MRDFPDVRGYIHWAAFGNFEFNHGYMPRFGLIGVERGDGGRRVVKPSARALGNFARSGRIADLAACDAGNEAATRT